MSVKDIIGMQAAHTRSMRAIGPKGASRKTRISTNKQIDTALDKQLKEILANLHDMGRTLPADWQRGFNAAMTTVANYKKPSSPALTRPALLDILITAADIHLEHRVLEPIAGKGGLFGLIPDSSSVTAVEYDIDRYNYICSHYPDANIIHADIHSYVFRHDFERILFVSPVGAIEATKLIKNAATKLTDGGKLVTLIRQSACKYILTNIPDATLSDGLTCDDGCGYCILTIEN